MDAARFELKEEVGTVRRKRTVWEMKPMTHILIGVFTSA